MLVSCLGLGWQLDMDYDSFICIVFNYKQCYGKAKIAADQQQQLSLNIV